MYREIGLVILDCTIRLLYSQWVVQRYWCRNNGQCSDTGVDIYCTVDWCDDNGLYRETDVEPLSCILRLT